VAAPTSTSRWEGRRSSGSGGTCCDRVSDYRQERHGRPAPAILNGVQRERLERERELDFSYLIEELARFRGSYFFQMDKPGGVFRVIPIQIATLEELGLPEVLKEIVSREQGLILVTGPTGSGKSTTLAAMVNYLEREGGQAYNNHRRPDRILYMTIKNAS